MIGASREADYSVLYENIYIGVIMILKAVLAAAAGAALGFAYYKLIGCRSGSCPMTGSAPSSMITGAVIGFLLFMGRPS